MMWLDTFLYCVIGLYFDKVLPREYGVRYPWNFIFHKSFWCNKTAREQNVPSSGVKNGKRLPQEAENFSRKDVEAISLEMKQQELDGRCMQIRDLSKVYASRKGNCSAVNSLRLSLYENQILALLGHNGAGKSTTISMLVGLLPPTSGDALVFGKNITTDMDEIRKGLGVCPQHDILFPELTVREHLELFAKLKDVKENCLDSAITDMVDEELVICG
jgi:ATP-binding cassette subfamily A (ABC1) protein 3